MPLLFLLALILTIFLKRNPNLKKIFIIAILGHLLLLGFIYVYTALCVPRGIAFDDGDVFSQHAGIISFVLRDIDFNRAYLYEEIGTEGNYFDAFFGKKLIPPADSYAIGFITYFYSIIFAAYGYIPVFIHILNILLNLLTGIIIFKLSKILFNQQTALFALILFLFNPVTFYYATTKLKEPLYFFASFLSIFFSVLAVKKKNIAYLVLNVPLLILVKLTKWAYFYPLLLTILIYLVLNFFSKRRLLIIVGLILIGMFIFLNRGFVYEKEREIFGAAEGMHKGHLTAIGYNYNLLIFGPELTQYTIKQKVIYTINAWYHLTFEPLLSNNISFRLLFYYPIRLYGFFYVY
ncbi:MAG: glycosyltransferase family 39 protein [Candidatus Omnitrophica bacterium]|nr:glycosyltransferase family 39 protein [Candidatus Omnitrophota bacterium]